MTNHESDEHRSDEAAERLRPNQIHEPTLEELGVTYVDLVTEEGGFTQGGTNETEVIRQVTSINSIPVTQLEADMQPSRLSSAGFLGQGESLVDILAEDNDTVRSFGLTHQEIAFPLRHIKALYEQGTIKSTSGNVPLPGQNEITVAGHPYRVGLVQWRGFQESPFKDGTHGSYDMRILNLENGRITSSSALLPELIARYGFYEGKGTGYRTAPEEIVHTFSHLSERYESQNENADPIVALTSGRVTEAVLIGDDQVTRFQRLFEAGLPRIREANVRIAFPSGEDALSFLGNESNAMLLQCVGMQELATLKPGVLRLNQSTDIQAFMNVLDRVDDEVSHRVRDLTSAITASGHNEWLRTFALETILKRSVKERDGVYVRQPATDLAEKIDFTHGELLDALYKAADGRYYQAGFQQGEPPKVEVELDEDKARALGGIFGNQVMPVIEGFREAMQIDAEDPIDEQVVAFLMQYHKIGKAQRIAEQALIKKHHPDIELPDWMRIDEIVEGMRSGATPYTVSRADRKFLRSHNFSVKDLLKARELYPTRSTESVIAQLYNGGLKKARRNTRGQRFTKFRKS
jgi:hypothetical protein